MFLNLLTENSEQIFFLKFAYLLAVAEKEDEHSGTVPIRAVTENPEKGEYEFEEFAPGFAMQTNELLMIRKFAEEMGRKWTPVSSYQTDSLDFSDFFEGLFGGGREGFLGSAVRNESAPKMQDALKRVARITSVAGMLKMATEELNNTEDRSAVLKFVLTALIMQSEVSSFSYAKRKAILFEAVSMAFVDGIISKYEEEVILYYCELCHLDKELIAEFQEMTKQFFRIYTESLELITE